jgi:septal ring factor EnvC (AmiA/AmiB activator)
VNPVAGRVVSAFGSSGDAGPAAGATIAALAGARVVSPCAGAVAFAQRFRSYGLLVIVDCGGARHVVLSGLARVQVRAGQTVRAGQPIGAMPEAGTPAAAGAPAGAGVLARPRLYVELRQAGEAVNPAPLLHLSP